VLDFVGNGFRLPMATTNDRLQTALDHHNSVVATGQLRDAGV
jgi:hypothetical protein